MYLSGISGLKTIAALSVVFYHLNQIRPNSELNKYDWDWYQFIETWSVAVSFFFIVSGVFLGLEYIKVREGQAVLPLAEKIYSRLIRLLPAFLFVVLVSWIVEIYLHGLESIQPLQLLGGMFLAGPFFHEAFFPSGINGALWYVAFDIWCFLIVSSILIVANKGVYLLLENKHNYSSSISLKKVYTFLTFWGIIILCSVCLLFLHSLEQQYRTQPSNGILSVWIGKYTLWIFAIHYLAGVLVAEYINFAQKYQKYLKYISDICFLGIGYSFFTFLWEIREVGDFETTYAMSPFHFPYTTIYIGGLLLFTPFLYVLKPIFENPVTRYISKISYSIYLIHGLFIALFLAYFGTGGVTIKVWYTLCMSTFVATILTAVWIHRTVERIEWWKSLFQRSPSK